MMKWHQEWYAILYHPVHQSCEDYVSTLKAVLKTKKCISMTAFNTHTYSVYMPRKRTCTFRLLSLNFQGKYLTFRVQKLIKNEMPFYIYFCMRAIRIFSKNAAKMQKLPD